MSLQLAAQHLAHHGRGDDKMLVHMTPKEVSGLQQLAQAHGGSLTVNPHTGLPEAGFLDSLLPTIIGAGLTYFSGGAINPMMAAGIVGGIQGVRTGDLSKGLMAGLGAYGGAGLTGGLMGAGAAAEGLAAQTTANAASQASGLTGAVSDAAAQQAVTDRMAGLSNFDKLSAGVQGLGSEEGRGLAMNALGGGMGAVKTGLMAAAPIIADQMVQTTTPTTDGKGQIHPFRYAGGRYERLPAIDADKFQGFADGGMTQDAAGGGMFNYAQMQPAVDLHPNSGVTPKNMAEGGVAHFDWGGEVTAAVNAGRMGFAPGTSAQDVVSSFNLNQDQAAQVAQQLGYTGDIKGLNYGAASTNPTTYASATPNPTIGYDALQHTENVLYPNQAPVYSNYSNQDYANFFADPKNAAVLQTPGGLAAAEAQYNADPRAVNNYIAGLATNYSDPTATQNGSGTLGTYQNLIKENVMPAAYITAQKAVNPNFGKTGDYWNPDTVAKAYQVADKVLKFDPLTDKVTPSDKEWVAFMDKNNLSTKDISVATGLSQNEVDRRYAAAKETPVAPTPLIPSTNTKINPTAPILGTGNAPTPAPPVPNPYGNGITPGDVTFNSDGSRTVTPNIPYRPYGGFTGINEVTNAFTKGGGHTGPANLYVPKSVEELNAKYKNTGGTQQMLDYLSGKTTENPILHPITPTGEISKDYRTSILGYPEQDASQKMYTFNPTTKKMMRNPDFIPTSYDSATGEKVYGKSINQIRMDFSKNSNMSDAQWLKYITDNHLEPQQIADATGVSLGEVLQHIQTAKGSAGSGVGSTTTTGGSDDAGGGLADGGMAHYNLGGYASGGIGDLGSYSDGGRLLRGPGDGVSDSIPATIGRGKPARLADGEFVVPARIVSELGNGSTEAGARKLYAMMDRVQNTRGKTIGKGKVAKNTRADKFLPA